MEDNGTKSADEDQQYYEDINKNIKSTNIDECRSSFQMKNSSRKDKQYCNHLQNSMRWSDNDNSIIENTLANKIHDDIMHTKRNWN